MLKQYSVEILIGLTVGFMIYYPPVFGSFIFAIGLAAFGTSRFLDQKELPELTSLKRDMIEVKGKVDQLILGRNR